MTEHATISLTQDIAYPPADVWRALTDPALVAKWWATGDIKPEVGYAFELDMGAFGKMPCTVLEVEPEKLFSYTFGEGMLDTTLTWRLEATDAGTLLHFEHAGFDIESQMGMGAYQGMGAGWPAILSNIESALA